SRTILSDKGGYTNVEGERCDAERGDIILTPNGTWHDHGNESKTPVIWIDMLDWPLMEFLDCAWVDQNFEPGSGNNAKNQDTVHKSGYSTRLYGAGGMVPTFRSPQIGFGRDPAPLIHFRGAKIREALEERRDPLYGVGCGAPPQYRSVSRPGQGQGRQRRPARAVRPRPEEARFFSAPSRRTRRWRRLAPRCVGR